MMESQSRLMVKFRCCCTIYMCTEMANDYTGYLILNVSLEWYESVTREVR